MIDLAHQLSDKSILYIENFMEQILWLAAHCFSFWYWKLGGPVKKNTLYMTIYIGSDGGDSG